jgi:hypothetical protein
MAVRSDVSSSFQHGPRGLSVEQLVGGFGSTPSTRIPPDVVLAALKVTTESPRRRTDRHFVTRRRGRFVFLDFSAW